MTIVSPDGTNKSVQIHWRHSGFEKSLKNRVLTLYRQKQPKTAIVTIVSPEGTNKSVQIDWRH